MESPSELQSFTFNDIDVQTNSDMDNFINTLSGLKAEPIQPEHAGMILMHYASAWLPELFPGNATPTPTSEKDKDAPDHNVTSMITKKKLFVETLISILPPDPDCVIPCDFLLRLLRAANMFRAGDVYVSALERRVSGQLDGATLEELMIPCFSHMSTALLDFGLVLRLVRGFVGMEEVSRSGGAVAKVAKLVDCYLAEAAAIDSHVAVAEFAALAGALPGHARATDDVLYRAVDTYLKAHPRLSKQDRKKLARLVETRKLSQEACRHVLQNDRMPVRSVLHLFLSEQTELNKHVMGWSGPHHTDRCMSNRGTGARQHVEIERLKEDVLGLQSQCMEMEKQIERLMTKRRRWISKSK